MADETETGVLEDGALTIDAPAGAGGEDKTTQTQADDAPSYEDRAMAMGWTPKTQFKGDPEKWVDAETFVKRGEEFLPFLKANNRRLEQALDKANTKLAGLEKAVERSIEHISRADQRAYARARAELEAELEQAASNGDAASVKAITKDIVDLEKEVSGAGKPEKGADPEIPAEMQAWMDDNPWYGKDKALTAACQAIANDVFDEGYTGKAQLAEVDKRLRAEFPHKFTKPENPNRRAAASVEGPGAAVKAGKTYADLPPEAKQMCDEFCRDIKGFTREKFVKDYYAQEAKK